MHNPLTPAPCTYLVMWLRNCTALQMAMEAKGDIERAVDAKEDLDRRAIDKDTLIESIKRVKSNPREVEMEILLLWNVAQ